MKKGVVWFRNDLRLTDQQALIDAAEACDELLLIYVADPRMWTEDQWGISKTGVFRTQFLWESLQDLRDQLEVLGAELWFRWGKPEDVIPTLMKEQECTVVWATKEHTREELQVEQRLEEQVECAWVEQLTLIHPQDLPMSIDDIPDIFTAFRKQVEKPYRVRNAKEAPQALNTIADPDPQWDKDLPGPRQRSTDPRGVLQFVGGENAGKDRIQHYFWDTKRLGVYKNTRNGLIGPDYSSKFSPWLANGSLSPRMIYHQVRAYEAEYGSNQSTYWLIFELLWRDYFRFVAMKYGKRIFLQGGVKSVKRRWKQDMTEFDKWRLGRTPEPFVNANMQELRRTGWMSNRGRQNVASYLVHDMGMDWRMGAAWFEHCLLDYDPCSNYGNWNYVAGVGNDPRPNRKFNIERQVSMYDPQGKYIQKWNNGLLEFEL